MLQATKQEMTILIADDDTGHAKLVERNLRRAAVPNSIERFEDGQQILDFLFQRGRRRALTEGAYLVLLDIRMPKVDGIEVLRRLKASAELRRIPVIMLTTTDDPREVIRCHDLGCSNYIVKPVDCEKFAEAIHRLGHFVTLVEVPRLDDNP